MFDGSGGQHGIGLEFTSGGTLANNVFVWGHDTAIQFDASANTILLTTASIDFTPAYYSKNRVGVLFSANATLNKVSGNSFTSGGVGVVNKNALGITQANIVEVGRMNLWKDGAVQNIAGGLIISGTFEGTTRRCLAKALAAFSTPMASNSRSSMAPYSRTGAFPATLVGRQA